MEIRKIKGINNKGQTSFEGIFFFMAVLFGFALFFIVTFYTASQVIPKINTALTSSTAVDPNSNVTEILDDTEDSIHRFNIWFPLLVIGLLGFVLLMAYQLKSHPAIWFIGLVTLCIAIILAVTFTNIYENISDADAFSNVVDETTIMELFMIGLPHIIVIIFIIIGLLIWLNRSGAVSTL
jgi:hypothetical protein